MSERTDNPPSVSAQKPRSRFWPNLRLIVITAVVTSLGWVFLLGYTDSAVVTGSTDKVLPEALDAMPGNGSMSVSSFQEVQGREPQPEGMARAAGGSIRIPVAGVKAADLVDTFTAPRGDRLHHALDIIVPQGSPVLAAADGTVEKLFVSEDGGNTIYVRSPDGARMYYYAHLLGYQPGLVERAFVRAGQQIGTVGATGNANPAVPHLHFQILQVQPGDPWWKGTPVNPYPILRQVR